jgi:hypothetical protein
VYARPGHRRPSYGTVRNNGVNVRFEFIRALSVQVGSVMGCDAVVWYMRTMSCLP